jgi:predicted metal-dependent hydrolase
MSLPYRIRTHPRARHVRLRLDPHDGLVVTVPRSFDQRRVPELIEQKRDWIESVQTRQSWVRDSVDSALLGPRPGRVDLDAIGKSWSIEYQHTQRHSLGFTARDQALIVQLPAGEPDWINDRLARRLRAWLFERARDHLVPLVQSLAQTHGFRHGPVTIRNQRSRWGSCSESGRLSLNARLLFASPEACHYVVVHELVHTEHPNHSRVFWKRVADLAPDYRLAMSELKTVWHKLPDWL